MCLLLAVLKPVREHGFLCFKDVYTNNTNIPELLDCILCRNDDTISFSGDESYIWINLNYTIAPESSFNVYMLMFLCCVASGTLTIVNVINNFTLNL